MSKFGSGIDAFASTDTGMFCFNEVSLLAGNVDTSLCVFERRNHKSSIGGILGLDFR